MHERAYNILPYLCEHRNNKIFTRARLHCMRDCTTTYVDIPQSVHASFVDITFHVYKLFFFSLFRLLSLIGKCKSEID